MKSFILILLHVHIFWVIIPNTLTQKGEDYFYEHLINFLYANYPDFITRLLTYNGTSFGTNVTITKHNVFNGYILETKNEEGYGILLSNAYSQKLRNGIYEGSKNVRNTLYKCQSAIHFCSGNPAYCEYHEGDKGTKFIVVAGHDGPLRPSSIPDRGPGCWVPQTNSCQYKHNCDDEERKIFKDSKRCNTKDYDDVLTSAMAHRLVEVLRESTGKQPHFIVNRIHRIKVDVNRDIEKGTFYVAEAVQAWLDFQNFIKIAKESFNGKWGMILDIHGNEVPEKWTMLGYGITAQKLDMGQFSAYDTSLTSLARRVYVPFQDLFNGKNSLGYFIEKENITVIPSPTHQYPKGRNYFSGDFIVKHHGSKDGGNIDAVQIEMPVTYRIETMIDSYITKIVNAILKFVDLNFYKKGEHIK